MGGGPVLEGMYVPYHWPFSRFFDLPLYATTSSPGYYGFDGRFPLVGFPSASQDRPSHTTYGSYRHEEANEAIANHDQVQTVQPDPRKGDTVSVTANMASVQSEGVKESDFQSEEVEKRSGFQSEDLEKQGGFQLEGGDGKKGGSVHPEEVEKEGRCQSELVYEKEGELQPEVVDEKEVQFLPGVEEEEVGSDEERRAATVLQARYRGHLVRMTRPLVQLRAIAGVEAKLMRLEEQVGSGAFQAELWKEKSMAKVGFEEETLALLMQLDSIQGSHPLVRQVRKSVVREIVDLQGIVDALLAGMDCNHVH